MHDAQTKSWGLWGDYLETLFTQDPKNMQLGISATTAFMHACRHNQEAKARKYIAKILWLLMYDDDKGTLSDTVDKFCMGVPPIQWLPWVPQLLTSLVRHGIDGKMFLNVLNQVGRMYPQAVYFPIRTLYLTLKVEQREKVRNAELIAQAQAAANESGGSKSGSSVKSPGVAQGEASPGGSGIVVIASGSGPAVNVTGGGSDGGASVTGMGGGSETNQGQSVAVLPATSTASGGQSTSQTTTADALVIKATPSMWRCSKLMHMQRDLHPTILASLEGIVDQVKSSVFLSINVFSIKNNLYQS
jgi:transformation/transcription domain-associated protein